MICFNIILICPNYQLLHNKKFKVCWTSTFRCTPKDHFITDFRCLRGEFSRVFLHRCVCACKNWSRINTEPLFFCLLYLSICKQERKGRGVCVCVLVSMFVYFCVLWVPLKNEIKLHIGLTNLNFTTFFFPLLVYHSRVVRPPKLELSGDYMRMRGVYRVCVCVRECEWVNVLLRKFTALILFSSHDEKLDH